MKLLFVTNIVSPHQMPLARCLARMVGPENFRYATTAPPMPERVAMGWDCNAAEPWVLPVYSSAKARADYVQWWSQADFVICAEREINLMESRLARARWTFYMSERWWKPPLGTARLLKPAFLRMALKFRQFSRSKHCFYLAIGVYAASDLGRLASFGERVLRWGYFTDLPPTRPPLDRPSTLNVMYAGRLLWWKKVDDLIHAFKQCGFGSGFAKLTIIGDGPRRNSLMALSRRLGIEEQVQFLSSLPMSAVWNEMERAHIFVLPSNGCEGWGAVLNEAMTRGCAIIAAHSAGASPILVASGRNGYLYDSGDRTRLGSLLTRLAEDESERQRLAKAGQHTVFSEWSPHEAAGRLVALLESLRSGQPPVFHSHGPLAIERGSHW